ncbi:hypothetical protein F66182_6880 [Fusarium sp. NRRL 66182]|nr:hypothetical protein F66182_6880 [Fusarium sp. NRRL 66182]
MATAPALNAYRHLLRAARIAFLGDAPMLSAAQLQIRSQFRQKASIDASEAPAAIQHAEEVAQVLRQNVVQGRKIEDGKDTYSELKTSIFAQEQGKGKEYLLIHNVELRIHEHIERGDNESIKTAGKGQSQGGCCGGGR